MLLFQCTEVLLLSHQKWCLWFYKYVNWKEYFNVFADLSKGDFLCPKALEAELDLWKTHWVEKKIVFQTIYEAH